MPVDLALGSSKLIRERGGRVRGHTGTAERRHVTQHSVSPQRGHHSCERRNVHIPASQPIAIANAAPPMNSEIIM